MLGKEKNLGTFQKALKYFKEALEHDPVRVVVLSNAAGSILAFR